MKIPVFTVLDMHGYYVIEKYFPDKKQRIELPGKYLVKDDAEKVCADLNEQEH